MPFGVPILALAHRCSFIRMCKRGFMIEYKNRALHSGRHVAISPHNECKLHQPRFRKPYIFQITIILDCILVKVVEEKKCYKQI